MDRARSCLEREPRLIARGSPSAAPAVARLGSLGAATALAIAWCAAWAPLSPALAQDIPEVAPPDTLVLPSYDSSYDRDRTRELWTQTLGWSVSTKRTALNLMGSVNTQNSLNQPYSLTSGNLDGSLNFKLAGTWLLILHGTYDMNSSADARTGSDSRGNRMNIRTQYLLSPVPAMKTYLALYTEFEQRQDLSRSDLTQPSPDTAAVDSSVAKRDSSFTSSRKDGVSGDMSWTVRPWLDFHGTALAYRYSP